MADVYEYDDFYREVAATCEHDDEVGGLFHYARSVFDFEAHDREELKKRCSNIPDRFMTVHGDATIVYVVGPEGKDHAKIGITKDMFGRLSGNQTGCWDRLKAHYCLCVYDDDAYTIEQSSLALAALRGIEIRGEWVGVPAEKAFELVLDAAEIAGALVSDAGGFVETQKDFAASGGHSRVRRMNEIIAAEKRQKWDRLGY